jgi:hypothetical protein
MLRLDDLGTRLVLPSLMNRTSLLTSLDGAGSERIVLRDVLNAAVRLC